MIKSPALNGKELIRVLTKFGLGRDLGNQRSNIALENW